MGAAGPRIAMRDSLEGTKGGTAMFRLGVCDPNFQTASTVEQMLADTNERGGSSVTLGGSVHMLRSDNHSYERVARFTP